MLMFPESWTVNVDDVVEAGVQILAVRVPALVNCVAYCTPPSQINELVEKPVPVIVTVTVPGGSGFGVTEVIAGGGGVIVK